MREGLDTRSVYVDKLAGERVDQKLWHFAISDTLPLLFIYLPTTQFNQQLAEYLILRLLMSYIYIYIYIYAAPILDVSRSHTTTHHSRQDSSGRVISSSQRPLPDNTRHSQQINIHAPGGIRTHDLSRWAACGTGGMDICLLWVSCVVR